jgi:histone deacetylase 1/2
MTVSIFANLLTFHDISHLTTPPHTPKQNSFSEQRHLYIVKTGLTLLSHASIPLSYCPYAFATTVYLINVARQNLRGIS